MEAKSKWIVRVKPDLAGINALGIPEGTRWCVAKAEWPVDEPDALKPKKNPKGHGGKQVATDNPEVGWFSSADDAYVEYLRKPLQIGTVGNGYIGLGLLPSSCPQPFVAFDIDGCLNGDGVLIACHAAVELLQSVGVYLEYSPSGTGLRGFAFGTIKEPEGGRHHIHPYEMYGAGVGAHYVTITGVPYV